MDSRRHRRTGFRTRLLAFPGCRRSSDRPALPGRGLEVEDPGSSSPQLPRQFDRVRVDDGRLARDRHLLGDLTWCHGEVHARHPVRLQTYAQGNLGLEAWQLRLQVVTPRDQLVDDVVSAIVGDRQRRARWWPGMSPSPQLPAQPHRSGPSRSRPDEHRCQPVRRLTAGSKEARLKPLPPY